jgi:hypothetical protein
MSVRNRAYADQPRGGVESQAMVAFTARTFDNRSNRLRASAARPAAAYRQRSITTEELPGEL